MNNEYNNNPFEPNQNPEHQDWWPDPDASMASTPDPRPEVKAETEAAAETRSTTETRPESEPVPAADPGSAADPEPAADPVPAAKSEQAADPEAGAKSESEAAVPPEEPTSDPAPQPQPSAAPASQAPDPTKPLPGETYADFLHRLDRERLAAEAEAAAAKSNRKPEEYWVGLGDHGRGRTDDPNYGPVPEEYAANGMSKASFVFGIMSLVSIIFNSSFFFGALGIIFALLSRKNKFSRQARIGLIMSAAGLATFVVTMAVTIFMLVSSGAWGIMMNMIDNMDPNNPFAVSEIQQAVLDELLGRSGVQNGTQSINGTADSGSEASASGSEAAAANSEAAGTTDDTGIDAASAPPVPAAPTEATAITGTAAAM